MKKVIIYFSILCLALVSLVGCKSGKESTTFVSSGVVATSIKESGTCNVSVEPKIELLQVVQYLAGDQSIKREKLSYDYESYSEDIKVYFSKYDKEPVVNLYKKMMMNGFSFSTPPSVMLYVDDNLNRIQGLDIPNEYNSDAGNEENIIKFYKLLAEFRKKTKFDEFYIQHKAYYTGLVSKVKEKLDKSGCIDKIIKYYGYKQNSYNFIIESLSVGGYAARVPSQNGKFDLYDFMVIPNNDEEFFQMIVHEFGHSYVNPLTEKNINEINRYDNLFTPIKQAMANQQYGQWQYCVNEHIVRSVAYRNLYFYFGKNASEYYINLDTSKNFIYINAITEKLKEYENNRDKYTTFDDFYPKLIEVFKELSEKQKG
ncbi:DUF4932 domain-containing protein [Clostridium fungisolvens]|uniref:DUF4932 domain-containing protein n=1 Tax=Clostridium fungisolvens TaxID=1604897 RepID=A0A6V8SFL0_9CLOT|nr:DUF4932 domain-containing protein [Clostridium fungisolvens]GFP75265.1 hypothetical protein bsdtw1_01338 [Clostridium fungisolvens]